MKRTLLPAVAVVFIMSLVTEYVFAAGSIAPSVTVAGAVSAACKAGTTGSLAFSIDPSAVGPISATTTDTTVFCSKGTNFTVTASSANKGGSAASCAGAGITGQLKDGANTMNYIFSCNVYNSGSPSGTNAGTGQGFGAGNDLRLGLGGSITASSYQNAPVSSSYTDTISLTIAY
ncbi:MAG: spore coat protein U domain-containing protein [Smithellaceae bacterium]